MAFLPTNKLIESITGVPVLRSLLRVSDLLSLVVLVLIIIPSKGAEPEPAS